MAVSTVASSRNNCWISLAVEVALLPQAGLKAGSATVRNRFRSASISTPVQAPVDRALAATFSHRTSEYPRKSAMKRPAGPVRRASLDSSGSHLSSLSDDSMDEESAKDSPEASERKLTTKTFMNCLRQIQLLPVPVSCTRKQPRTVVELPPAPDLDEVCILVESDDGIVESEDSDSATSSPLFSPRKVRFLVPAPPPPPPPESKWEEPAWCDFM
ncbi:hypothetical protein R3P38DRAFT_3447547 [Favolaschia claudopus]|uniref:Uncharacterized protein n=1 Tax=Favolaschia claudopus TaxID=2862362 RepID=A0AAW0CSZ5_9AGAR